MGGGEVMEAFMEEVSFELCFHSLLGLGSMQKLGWEKTFWAEQWGFPGGASGKDTERKKPHLSVPEMQKKN